MKPRNLAIALTTMILGSIPFALFIPIISIQAESVGAVYYSTTTTTEGNRTTTSILVHDWPTESSVASLQYYGNLYLPGEVSMNGTYCH